MTDNPILDLHTVLHVNQTISNEYKRKKLEKREMLIAVYVLFGIIFTARYAVAVL